MSAPSRPSSAEGTSAAGRPGPSRLPGRSLEASGNRRPREMVIRRRPRQPLPTEPGLQARHVPHLPRWMDAKSLATDDSSLARQSAPPAMMDASGWSGRSSPVHHDGHRTRRDIWRGQGNGPSPERSSIHGSSPPACPGIGSRSGAPGRPVRPPERPPDRGGRGVARRRSRLAPRSWRESVPWEPRGRGRSSAQRLGFPDGHATPTSRIEAPTTRAGLRGLEISADPLDRVSSTSYNHVVSRSRMPRKAHLGNVGLEGPIVPIVGPVDFHARSGFRDAASSMSQTTSSRRKAYQGGRISRILDGLRYGGGQRDSGLGWPIALSGIGILFFLVVHITDTFFVVFAPDWYDHTVALYGGVWFDGQLLLAVAMGLPDRRTRLDRLGGVPRRSTAWASSSTTSGREGALHRTPIFWTIQVVFWGIMVVDDPDRALSAPEGAGA